MHNAFTVNPESFCSNLRFVDILIGYLNLTQLRDVDYLLDVPLCAVFDRISLDEK